MAIPYPALDFSIPKISKHLTVSDCPHPVNNVHEPQKTDSNKKTSQEGEMNAFKNEITRRWENGVETIEGYIGLFLIAAVSWACEHTDDTRPPVVRIA